MQSGNTQINLLQREHLLVKFEKSLTRSSLMRGDTIDLKDVKLLLSAFGEHPQHKKWQIRNSIQLYFSSLANLLPTTSLKNQLKTLLVFQLLVNDLEVSPIFVEEFQDAPFLASLFCETPDFSRTISQTQPATTTSQSTSQSFKQSYFLYLQRIAQKQELLVQIKLKISFTIENDQQASQFFVHFFGICNILNPILKSYKNLNQLLGAMVIYKAIIDDIFVILMNDIQAFYSYLAKGINQILNNYQENMYSIDTLKQLQMILSEFTMITMHLQTFEHINHQIKFASCISIYKNSSKDIQNIQTWIDQMRLQNAGLKKDIVVRRNSTKKHYPLLSVCLTDDIEFKYQHQKTATKF